MNLNNNTIIKCNLNYGFKFINGLEEYDLVLIDDIDILIKYQKEIKNVLSNCSGLLLYIDKNIECSKINYLEMKLIAKKNINDKYLYFYGHKTIQENYNDNRIREFNKSSIAIINENMDENKEKFNLFNKNNVLSFNINRILNKSYKENNKVNVLDLTLGEELVQVLIVNSLYKVIILGLDKIKVRTTSAIYGQKINTIELII